MSIARVETPSACLSNSSPGNRADASSSVAPQLRIDLRSTRMYSPASAAAIATATVRLFTSDTDKGGLACAPSSHAASGVPRRDRSTARLRLAPTRTALIAHRQSSNAAAGDVLLIDGLRPSGDSPDSS